MAKIYFAGDKKRVVWAEMGKIAVAEVYFHNLPRADKARAEALFKKLANQGRIANDLQFKHEDDGIWCLKPGGHRFPCFIDGDDFVITHGFKKQRQKMSKGDLDRARTTRQEYLKIASQQPDGKK